jgi:hypothetical protein
MRSEFKIGFDPRARRTGNARQGARIKPGTSLFREMLYVATPG